MLQTPDPEQAGLLAKALGVLAGAAATVFGIFKLINSKDAAVVKGHGDSISELFRNARADKIEINAAIDSRATQLGEQIERLADTQRLDREAILAAIREERSEVNGSLTSIKDGFAAFREDVANELGKRPTRDEVGGMLYQPGRRK